MNFRLALVIWAAQFTTSSSVLSLRRDVDFHCDVQPLAPILSQPFFEVLFKALVTGRKPEASLKATAAHNVSKAMALLPALPMANASSGILDRLAPIGSDSEAGEMDEVLSALDGIYPIGKNATKSNSSGLSVTGETNASGIHGINVLKKRARPENTLESKESVDADFKRVNASFAKMQCIFESMLSDHCGHLMSMDAARRGSWESVCLDPKHKTGFDDVYALMSAEERKYSRKIRHMTPVGHHTVELWNDNEQYKAILCVQMKIVDDGCISFKEPRFSTDTRGVKSANVVRGFVNANKTRSTAKPLKKKVEIGTMSAEKDDATKLVRDELEAVRNMKQ